MNFPRTHVTIFRLQKSSIRGWSVFHHSSTYLLRPLLLPHFLKQMPPIGWERQSCPCSPWTFLPGDKAPTQPVLGFIALCGNIFPYFRLNGCSFVLLKHAHQWLSGPQFCFQYFRPHGGAVGVLPLCEDLHVGQLACVGCWERPNRHEGPKPTMG